MNCVAPDQLVHVRLQEERVAEAERRCEPDAGVGREVRGAAVRGRVSREYVKCASFSRVDDSVVNQLTLPTLMRAGSPSIPFAELP